MSPIPHHIQSSWRSLPMGRPTAPKSGKSGEPAAPTSKRPGRTNPTQQHGHRTCRWPARSASSRAPIPSASPRSPPRAVRMHRPGGRQGEDTDQSSRRSYIGHAREQQNRAGLCLPASSHHHAERLRIHGKDRQPAEKAEHERCAGWDRPVGRRHHLLCGLGQPCDLLQGLRLFDRARKARKDRCRHGGFEPARRTGSAGPCSLPDYVGALSMVSNGFWP
jgi:hypothetical protein